MKRTIRALLPIVLVVIALGVLVSATTHHSVRGNYINAIRLSGATPDLYGFKKAAQGTTHVVSGTTLDDIREFHNMTVLNGSSTQTLQIFSRQIPGHNGDITSTNGVNFRLVVINVGETFTTEGMPIYGLRAPFGAACTIIVED